MRCIITGSNGYVGSKIKEYLNKSGVEVIELIRTPSTLGNVISYKLGEEPNLTSIGADALIHCAYDMGAFRWADIENTNISGSIKLLRAAKDACIKYIILISSISAYNECQSLYGKAKLCIEDEAAKIGAHIIRPGLVYSDGSSGGMVGTLTKLVNALNLIPVVGGSKKMFLCHEQDLANLVLKIITNPDIKPSRPILAANAVPLTFLQILKSLAEKRGKMPIFIPIPWQLAWLGLKLLELLGIRPPFKSDSLISLMYPDPNPDFSTLDGLGVKFREF